MRDIRWVFFDLGSTLVDETAADLRRIQETTAGTEVTVAAYRAKRLAFIRQGLPGDAETIRHFGLTKAPWHSEDERPCPDAAPTLAALAQRGLQLGIIANQNPGTAQRLTAWGLRPYFQLLATSGELGVAKPDPAIFRWALAQAGCEPAQAMMVGDRLDNDIAPAKALGMHTVRLLRGLGACQQPQSPAQQAEYTVETLTEVLELV